MTSLRSSRDSRPASASNCIGSPSEGRLVIHQCTYTGGSLGFLPKILETRVLRTVVILPSNILHMYRLRCSCWIQHEHPPSFWIQHLISEVLVFVLLGIGIKSVPAILSTEVVSLSFEIAVESGCCSVDIHLADWIYCGFRLLLRHT